MAMVLIRTPELKDIPSLQKLFLQLGYQTDVERLENHINQKHTSLSILVAEAEKELCGVIVMNFITPVHENGLWALISALVIDESSRGTGIGKKLLIASEQIALDKGCSQIELSSSERRIRAHKFYESHGYQEVRKRFVKLLADMPIVK
ncbi:acetyltransferase, GNAT family [Escherichia coli H605]|uniref:Acetyltransferase, GNAT family n=2 Tax=Escherichia TaxID=561 RepID=A0AAJ3P292_ECOLX|nr:acetyltransferase, GNAT family [Escherichia coli H605]